MADAKIFDHSTLRRNTKQVFSEIDSEIVMLDLQNEEYYSLNQIASEIWNSIEQPIIFEKLINQLLNKYEIDEKTCKIETTDFLVALEGKGLISITS